MNERRLHELLEAYGADPARWPAAERDTARALLEGSTTARRAQEAAARLDALLDSAAAEPASGALAARVLAGARAHATAVRGRRRRQLAAAVVPLAAAAGLAVWLARAPEPAPGRLASVPLADLGVYETSTDALLAYPAVDVVDADPALGCADPWTDCDTTTDPAPGRGPRSEAIRRMHA